VVPPRFMGHPNGAEPLAEGAPFPDTTPLRAAHACEESGRGVGASRTEIETGRRRTSYRLRCHVARSAEGAACRQRRGPNANRIATQPASESTPSGSIAFANRRQKGETVGGQRSGSASESSRNSADTPPKGAESVHESAPERKMELTPTRFGPPSGESAPLKCPHSDELDQGSPTPAFGRGHPLRGATQSRPERSRSRPSLRADGSSKPIDRRAKGDVIHSGARARRVRTRSWRRLFTQAACLESAKAYLPKPTAWATASWLSSSFARCRRSCFADEKPVGRFERERKTPSRKATSSA
jgi:hypothetical protein